MTLLFKKSTPLFFVFFLISLAILSSRNFLSTYFIDANLLMGANLFFLIISFISTCLQINAMSNKNPNVFIRMVMVGLMLKMFLTIIAIIIYVVSSGNNYNKRGVFVGLFFYLIYLATEVFTVLKLNKKNA